MYLRLPWKARVSQHFENQIKQTVYNSYAVQPRVIFTTRRLLPSIRKDVLSTIPSSNVHDEFKCRCGARYVGRTSLWLRERVKQYVPLTVLHLPTGQRQPRRTWRNVESMAAVLCVLTIGSHLLSNPQCAEEHNLSSFWTLSKGRNVSHLRIMEATFIKSSDPILSRLKEFVH